ncbi:hypothetical protein [Paenibacillus sp. UNC451MF]|uniref:hypothetical protein n=1 Tax=Paenibacillus sp. UNC451MF TaxID=1449063 RepID=UPI0004918AD7|nr:hypothetical protein [Paenibacillus sp. UNC451MF]
MTAEYFHEQESMRFRFGDDDRGILGVLTDRYIGANPPVPFTFRAFARSGILQTEEGLYDLNWGKRFPDAKLGPYAYAYGKVWSDG